MSNDKSIVQHQKINDGEDIVITRNGKHQYKFHRVFDMTRGRSTDSELMPGVTTIAKHIGGDNFSVGMNWALKKVRDSGGDVNAPRTLGAEATASGNLLHEDIDKYIKDGTIPPEDHDLFMLWHRELGSRNYVSSEQLVIHEAMSYGGTIDAISKEPEGMTLWDWKTKEKDSFEKYGNYPNEFAQISAYAQALHNIKHPYAPTKAYIANIMRDGSTIHLVPVDLEYSSRLFLTGYNMYHTLRENANNNQEGDKL